MGPAPAPPLPERAAPAAEEQDDNGGVDIYDLETQHPGGEIYDADTQVPGGIAVDRDGEQGPAAAAGGSGVDDDDQTDTEPLASVAGNSQQPTETTAETHQGGAGVDAGADETQLEHAGGENVAPVDEEGNGTGDCTACDDGGGAGADGGYPHEPPTQVLPLDIEDTDEEEEDHAKAGEGGDGDQAALEEGARKEKVAEQGATAENATAAAASALFSRDNAPTGAVGEGNGDAADDGDETADEGDTAGLFNTQEEEEIGRNSADAGANTPSTVINAGAREGGSMSAPRGRGGFTITGAMEPQYPVGSLVTSPGGSSEATTERQESPGLLSHELGANREQGYASVAVALDTEETFAGEGGKPEEGENGADEGERDGGDDPGSDTDDGSTVSSGALIPAGQDLTGFETELPEARRSDNQDNAGAPPAQHQIATDTPRASHTGESAGGAVAGDGDAAHESGSETEATQMDTDDGDAAAVESIRPVEAPHVAGSAAPVSDDGAVAQSSEGSRQEESSSPGEVRSPGGTLLRRTTTEDAMKAIAREQQRAEAAGAAAAAARIGANDIADESDETEDEPHTEMEPPLPPPPPADEDVEADLEGGAEPDTEMMTFAEPETEVMEVELNVDGDDGAEPTGQQRRDSRNDGAGAAYDGASIAESPADVPAAKETVPSDQGTAAVDVDAAAGHGGSASATPAKVDDAKVGASTDVPPPGEAKKVGDGHENDHGDETEGENMVEQEGKQDRRNKTDGEEKAERKGKQDDRVRENNDERKERARAPTTQTASVRSSGRRRTKKKQFGEEATPPKPVSGEETPAASRGGKRRRSSPSSTTTAAGGSEATGSRISPPPLTGNTSKRGRRTSAAAAPKASGDEPRSVQRKPPTTQSSGGRAAGRTRTGSSSQQTEMPTADGGGETSDLAATPDEEAKGKGAGKGKGRGGGRVVQGEGAGRGGKKRKAGVTAEELQDKGGGGRSNEGRKGSRKRKAIGGEGEPAEGMDTEEPVLEDDDNAVFQSPARVRRRSTKSEKGRKVRGVFSVLISLDLSVVFLFFHQCTWMVPSVHDRDVYCQQSCFCITCFSLRAVAYGITGLRHGVLSFPPQLPGVDMDVVSLLLCRRLSSTFTLFY